MRRFGFRKRGLSWLLHLIVKFLNVWCIAGLGRKVCQCLQVPWSNLQREIDATLWKVKTDAKDLHAYKGWPPYCFHACKIGLSPKRKNSTPRYHMRMFTSKSWAISSIRIYQTRNASSFFAPFLSLLSSSQTVFDIVLIFLEKSRLTGLTASRAVFGTSDWILAARIDSVVWQSAWV